MCSLANEFALEHFNFTYDDFTQLHQYKAATERDKSKFLFF